MGDWAAPGDGWYEIGSGEPRKISDEEAAAMMRGEEAAASIVWFMTGEEDGTAWSAAMENVMLPGGQILPPRVQAVLLDTVPYEG
jgi:hypothetical protein